MRPDDARRFLEVHHQSVRGLAVNDYPGDVIEAWAPLPITDDRVARFLVNRDDEIRIVAEIDGAVVGIGALVVAHAELRACYVAPGAARRGVGTAIVGDLERQAREHGLRSLTLEASVTAEPFYVALGYSTVRRGTLAIAPGVSMAAITMQKTFR